MQNISVAERNKMALTYGLIVGIIYIVLISASNIFVTNMIAFYAVKFVSYVLYMVALGIMLARIRKADGGYMEFRDALSALFLMVLIAGLMTYIYNYLYIQVIDTQFMNKIRASTVSFMEKMKVPDEKVEDALRKFDKQVAESKSPGIGKMILTFLEGIVMDTLFGLIVCLIVKKNRPVFEN